MILNHKCWLVWKNETKNLVGHMLNFGKRVMNECRRIRRVKILDIIWRLRIRVSSAKHKRKSTGINFHERRKIWQKMQLEPQSPLPARRLGLWSLVVPQKCEAWLLVPLRIARVLARNKVLPLEFNPGANFYHITTTHKLSVLLKRGNNLTKLGAPNKNWTCWGSIFILCGGTRFWFRLNRCESEGIACI